MLPTAPVTELALRSALSRHALNSLPGAPRRSAKPDAAVVRTARRAASSARRSGARLVAAAQWRHGTSHAADDR